MNANEPDVSQALHDLLLEDHEISDFLNEVARLTAQHFSRRASVLCGVTMQRPKRNAVVASSSAQAMNLDEIQAGFDEGPCLEAQRTGTFILVADTRYETRWPHYMKTVHDSNLRSIMAVPLPLAGEAKAAMNFYSEHINAFTEADSIEAQQYARLAAKVVQIALRITTHAENAAHRQAAMESRTAIDIAIGIVMVQSRCSQDEAFAILQRASSHRNIKLRILAEEIVASIGQAKPATAFET